MRTSTVGAYISLLLCVCFQVRVGALVCVFLHDQVRGLLRASPCPHVGNQRQFERDFRQGEAWECLEAHQLALLKLERLECVFVVVCKMVVILRLALVVVK
jgi:hypothetical protein